jgi:nucleoside-diphosphate-sugar epimerase
MKNILILGSAGQIGNYLCEYLQSKNYKVEKFDIVDGEEFDLRIYQNPLLEEKIKNSDFVYFLAFDVGGSRYLNKYQHTYEFIFNNCMLMTNTFDLLNKYKKQFIFASSQMSNMSYSPYGVLKSIGESYTKSLKGRVVKFWNVYGIEHDFEKSHVITDFILKAKNTQTIDMLTDGQETRQFLYAEDCVECLEIMMDNFSQTTENDELHVTSFTETKVIDIANYIASKFNAKVIPSKNIDAVQKDKKNKPDEKILNYWKPKTNIKDGIDKIISAMC